MRPTMAQIVARFRKQRVLVVGEAMLDCYYNGHADRISPEGPVPVVACSSKVQYPGGATNAAANVAALGGAAHCVSVVGADAAGQALAAELAARGVTADLLVDAERTTLHKLRIVADGHYVVRFDEGERTPLTPELEDALIERLRAGFAECSAVIVADYCYGILSERVIAELGRLKEASGRLVLVDSKDLPLYRGMAASVITPNHLEAQRAAGWSVRDVDRLDGAELEALGQQLLATIGSRWALVTLGAKGSLLFEHDQPTYRIAPRPVPEPHVSGAGDTFTATLALALAADAPVRMAAEIAAEAAAVVVGKPGTATVTVPELLQRLASVGLVPERGADLDATIMRYRAAGKRIVFTNGVFDGLTGGSIAFLRMARSLGDVLVVGVNSDRGAAARRGYRPRVAQAERVALVAALDLVDHVVVFDEPTPEATIRRVRPHIHAKGGDYQGAELPEAAVVQEVGGEVVILPLLDDRAHGGAAGKILRA